MTPRFLARWWRQLLAVLLVLATLTGYALARGSGTAGGAFSASPTASSTPDAAEPATGPDVAGGRGGVTPPTGGTPVDPGGPHPGTGGTAGSTTSSRRATTTSTSRSQHWAIRWILSLGPKGPDSPIFYIEPYLRLRERACDAALASVDSYPDYFDAHSRSAAVYRGAATACLAAFHQQPQRWAEARQHLTIASSSGQPLNCPERATLVWLERIVELHEQDPQRPFVLEESQGSYINVARLVPDHGGEGDEVRVEGSNLDCTRSVEVSRGGGDPKYATFTHGPGGQSLTFTAPGGFSPGRVTVAFLNNDENYTVGEASFTYDDETASSTPGPSAGG
jgi:hypothetical protein